MPDAAGVAGCAVLLFAAVLTSAVTAQDVAPPDAARLAPGFRVDAYGCVVAANANSGRPLLPPEDPGVRASFEGYPAALARYRVMYADSRGDLLNAVALRRGELRASTDDETQKDADIRLPLSIDLARLGDAAGARAIWLRLANRMPESIEPVFARPRHRNDDLALQHFKLDNSVNPAFEDSGAAAHLQRGINAAHRHDLDGAVAQWRLAVRCSPDFGWPHLLLGVAEEVRGKHPSARAQWLDTLGSYEPQPPGPRFINAIQYEAMRLLLAQSAP